MRRLLYLLAAAACGGATVGPPADGELAAQWAGSDTGGFRAPAAARWCVRDTLLEVFATRNDTAVGLLLLPKDTVAAGGFSVLSTEIFIPIRPQAGVALRFMEPGELKGFAGASGQVTVTEASAAGVSGTFEAALRREGTPDSVRLSGSFARVPIGPGIPMCGRANRPSAG